ncbi:putative membrane protein [Pseudobutyrivibrio sp. OR37]|uniref:YhgE/Pip domain-containing protein n=1 Tax=Pseudobutyrivibrio sp. OR37 TaxID=1798186 RepID=UPI0008F31B82|nr:YhgE/Pip domain-containing protein [Pseudobutyrivibrio sp. OR37]SFH81017.1 putative membrane protein [Pseudobutyrivibrio sp. OR37]
MKTVKKIFVDDVVGLVKNYFALVIVIGICFLPALYAWFNIYSNWDPYGNTGALKFAAVSLDKGFTDEDGEYHNQGDTIIENLHENTAVNWQFVDSAEEATAGVYSGEYYAAVVVDEDFTYDMYNVLTEEVDRPTLHFYENQKKNPVATKISDTVVQTLQNNINVAFTEVVVSEVFSNASEFSDEVQAQGGVEKVTKKLKTLSNDLTRYQNALTTIIENDAKLQASLAVAKQDATNIENQAKVSANAIKDTQNVSNQVNVTVNSYSSDVNDVFNIINSKVNNMSSYIDTAAVESNVAKKAEALKNAAITATQIEQLIYSLPKTIGQEKIDDVKNNVLPLLREIQRLYYLLGKDTTEINQAIAELDSIDEKIASSEDKVKTAKEKEEKLKAVDVNTVVAKGADKIDAQIAQAKKNAVGVENIITGDLKNKINSGLNSLSGMLGNTNLLLNNVGETFGNLVVMFSAIDNSVDCANTSLQKTKEAIVYVNGRLIDVVNDVEKASESEKLKVLVNALSGDPEVYGKFFSTPVEVVTEAVYPIENYGSAVAPFYSTLAFWVGALILTAIIKVHPNKAQYPDASQRQLFFGRYALYWILGQLQSIIIVSGDILLLHVQCLHPGLFFLAGSFIATTFTILIYSLVVTWGDAGKALAVVLVVIQIAGSSGTYPIELLPDFFKKVYIFFPFPYAINAIRECLCGLYKLDYLKYIGTLVVFMAVSIVIGLLIKIPFEPINHYMEERMEDTEMM